MNFIKLKLTLMMWNSYKSLNFKAKSFLYIFIIFFIPSPYEFFNFPLENLITLLTFILTYLILINIKNANLVLIPLLLVLKMSSLTALDNSYEICISSYTEITVKCENSFTQYTFFKTDFSYKTLEIDYGIKQDKKTLYGHASSNWKTNYITGLNGKARAGSIHYQWLPFSAEIQKKFTHNKNIEITYLGDIKIYEDKKLIFEDINYENIKTVDINTKNSNYNFQYTYNHPEGEKFVIQETSLFNIIDSQQFATLRINESTPNLIYILYFLIITVFLIRISYSKFKKRAVALDLFLILPLICINLIIYFYVNSQLITTVLISSIILFLKFINKDKLLKIMIIISPIQILKLFEENVYSMPRIPGTVPQHHQIKSLGMNEVISVSNYLKGGDKVFYEPPLFRYLLHTLNILFGSKWYFVCFFYLAFIIFLLSKNLGTKNELFSYIVVFFLLNMFFSSGFLNLLLYGWSEPFFILILLFLIDFVRSKQKITGTVMMLITSLILIRPESILYLSVFTYLIYKNFNLKNIKSLLPVIGLFLPLMHNLYFGNEFLLFSSTGNELGYFDFLSKDGSVPIEQNLSKLNLSKIYGIFFYPFNSISLIYVGRGFLVVNLFIFLITIFNCFKYKFTIYYLTIIFLSFAPYLIYDIYDGYPRRALALTTACILVNCCMEIFSNYDKNISKNS